MNIKIQNATLKKNKITYAECEATRSKLDSGRIEFALHATNRDFIRKRFTLMAGSIVEDESGRYVITEVWFEASPKNVHLITRPTDSFSESYSNSTKLILNEAMEMSNEDIEDSIRGLSSYLSLRAKAV